MKLKEGIITTKTGDGYVAVDAGVSGARFHGMIMMNETAKTVLEKLENDVTEDELVSALCGEYEVSREKAAESVSKVLERLRGAGLIEE